MQAVPTSTLTMGLGEESVVGTAPMNALLDYLIPGFSIFTTAIQKYAGVDINLYIPALILLACVIVAWRYFSDYFGEQIQQYLMSVVDVRTDDEIYNMLMAWVAAQRFSQGARRFVANTNLNSRMYWYMWHMEDNDDEEEELGEDGMPVSKRKKKALTYTPTFGSHWFFYKGRILIFKRQLPAQPSGYFSTSEREEISIACFGRNPWILKELLHEARMAYLKRDEAKTLIYRGAMKGTPGEPTWQRCMARTSRPFSTVILNEEVKQDLIKDVTDYLNPATRRWYSNRGIPYRRGYLLHGPPGTGKSSLSLALAGFFKMRIYIVSLSSITSNEENLAALFAELPRRCVVLLEDIDSAGLTHARDSDTAAAAADAASAATSSSAATPPAGSKAPAGAAPVLPAGRLTLSGLLNILDGVASQEGRVLIMTTNHVDKLDSALIRPGRVDMIVKFDRADKGMTAAIFRAIYAPLEGDEAPSTPVSSSSSSSPAATATTTNKSKALSALEAKLSSQAEEEKKKAEEAEKERKKQEILEEIDALAKQFAEKVPSKEFSPAEIQGFLLKHKRDPKRAVEGAAEWVVLARKEQKERAAKELKEAEEKKKKEEEEEKKKKKEEEEAEKKKKEKGKSGKKKKSGKKAKKEEESESEEEDGSESAEGSESESESEEERRKRRRRKARRAVAVAAAAAKKSKKSSSSLTTPTAAPAAPAVVVPEEESDTQTGPKPPLTPPLSGSEMDKSKAKDAAAAAGAAAAVVVGVPEALKIDTEMAMGLGVGEAGGQRTGDSGYGEVVSPEAVVV